MTLDHNPHSYDSQLISWQSMHNLEFIPLEALASLKVVNWYSVCTDFLEASLVVLN